jgi:hypothetical protein
MLMQMVFALEDNQTILFVIFGMLSALVYRGRLDAELMKSGRQF